MDVIIPTDLAYVLLALPSLINPSISLLPRAHAQGGKVISCVVVVIVVVVVVSRKIAIFGGIGT